MLRYLIVALAFTGVLADRDCVPSLTTVSGTAAPTGVICPGDLIFEDNFDTIDLSKWQRENTLSGGGVSIIIFMFFFV